MSFENWNLSKANISFLKKSIKINDAREFIKQPIDTLAKNIEDHYFIKYSLNDKPKNKTISKSKYSNLFANSDETSNFLKQSSTKEESFSKNERLSSFCTYRESIKKKSISRVCNLDDSFIFDPKDITIKTKTINSNLEFINLYNFFLTKSSIFGWFNISKKELQNKIDLSKDKFKLGIFEKEKKIQEQDQKIFELNNRILSLQNENLILRNKNRELKIDFKYNKANIIEKFFYEQSIEKKDCQESDSDMLKKELKVLQSKLFKIKCENKSLYECLSKTEFQCSESLILKKFQEMEDYFKISQEQLSVNSNTMKKTNHEILNFRNYMKSILELQNNYHNEEIQKDRDLSDQFRKNKKKISCILKLVIGIHETLQGIKGNRDPDIDSILLQKLDFYVKNGEFLSENLLKPNEYIYILQEIEQIYSEIFSTIEKIMVIASEFYHQKYFNKYLLG